MLSRQRYLPAEHFDEVASADIELSTGLLPHAIIEKAQVGDRAPLIIKEEVFSIGNDLWDLQQNFRLREGPFDEDTTRLEVLQWARLWPELIYKYGQQPSFDPIPVKILHRDTLF